MNVKTAITTLLHQLQRVERENLEIYYQEIQDGSSVYYKPAEGYHVYLVSKYTGFDCHRGPEDRQEVFSFRITDNYLEMGIDNTCVRYLTLADEFTQRFDVELHSVKPIRSIGELK